MQVENGLPYLTWSDFTIIRRQLSQAYKARRRFHGARAQSDAALESVTMEELIACELGKSKLCNGRGAAAAETRRGLCREASPQEAASL